MVEIERVRRPFWTHQLVEYLVGIGLISAAVQMPQPAVPAVLGLVIILNAAIAKGAAGAFRLAGKRTHKLLDVVVMLLLIAGAVQPWISIDNTSRLMLGGVAFVLWFVWFHTDFTEKSPAPNARRRRPPPTRGDRRARTSVAARGGWSVAG